MQLSGLDLFFWAIGLIEHALLLHVLWIRRRIPQFPFFTALITADIIRTTALYVVLRFGTRHEYFSTFWSLGIVDVALQLAVVYELGSHVFRPLGAWAPDVQHTAFWLVSGSIAVAAGITWLAAPATRNWRQIVIIRGAFFSSALMSELFVAMVALSVMVGLPWNTHVARIAQGLGAYSILCILIDAGQSLFGVAHNTQTYATLSHIRIAAYLSCVCYWIVTLWRDSPRPRQMPDEMRRQLSALQQRVAYDLHRLGGWRRG